MNKDHVEKSLDTIRVIFEKASERIEALRQGEKIPATKLAADLAEQFDTTGPALYPVLIFLIRDYPGIKITRGAKGGLTKL